MARVAHDEITFTDGRIVGPLRRSVNQAQSVRDSIHNDAVASKLGFRGGTVAGSIHLELFPPLLLEAFGPRWFECGTLSINFRNPTVDREEVRASIAHPAIEHIDAQVDAKIEREDGLLVGEGTASVGCPPDDTYLTGMDLSKYEPGELRILDGIKAGDDIDEAKVTMGLDAQSSRRDVITEPLDWYFGESPWDGPIASPATMVHYLYAHPARVIGRNAGRAVGLFGAIELRNIHGPLVLDHTYRVGGEIIAVGESPKTEYVWFESYADSLDGLRVAEMFMQLRFMKDSSPLYSGGA